MRGLLPHKPRCVSETFKHESVNWQRIDPIQVVHTVRWPQIVAFRNTLIHADFGIDREVLWRAATHRCPLSRGQIAEILAADFGAQDGSSAE